MLIAVALTIGGLIALLIGGELLVRGAVGIAERARLSPLVVGVVVVGLGTSMPELVTSIEAVLAGAPDLAWGNIFGSNIANVLLILGAAAIVTPMSLKGEGFLREPLLGLGAAIVVVVLALGNIGHAAFGIALLAMLAGGLVFALRRDPAGEECAAERAEETVGWTKPSLLTASGLGGLILGGGMLIEGAIGLAGMLGMSEAMIGVTVVAIGTSFPELVTAIIAARRGEPEIAFGNIAGSNLFNLLLIGGATMTLAPVPIPRQLVPFDLFMMLGAALALAGLAYFRKEVSRRSGIALLLGFAVFIAWHVSRV